MKRKLFSLLIGLCLVSFALFIPSNVIPAKAQALDCPSGFTCWDGEAGDGLWTSATNWTTNLVPDASTDVLLNNSSISGSYIVTIPPTASNPQSVRTLKIIPDTGNTIRLVVQNGSGSAAALVFGDGTSTITDDITLDSGAVLQNSAGTTSGNSGIQPNNPTGVDVLRINDGAKYTHNCACSPRYLLYVLAKKPTTRQGIFEYDYPIGSAWTLIYDYGTYGTLMLSASGGSFTYSLDPLYLIITGNMIINSGATWSIPSATSWILIRGDLVNNGNTLVFPSTLSYGLYFGSYTDYSFGTSVTDKTTHTITGSGAINFNSATTVQPYATLNLSRDFDDGGTLVVNGVLNTGTYAVSGTGGITLANGATLELGSPDGIDSGTSVGNIRVSGTRTYNSGANYIFDGALAQITGNGFPTPVNNLTINNNSGVTLSNATTVNGTLALPIGSFSNGANLTLGDGATVNRSAGSLGSIPTFGSTVNVIYSGATAVTAGNEIPTSSSVLNNLTVNNTSSGGVTLASSPTVNGNLAVGSGAVFDLATYDITVKTAVTNLGTLKQVKPVNNANVEFLHITDGGTTTQYRGVDINTIADLGNVAVYLRGNAGKTCTSDSNSPAYAPRCFLIHPDTVGSATIKLWVLTSEIPGGISVPAIYHYTTTWEELSNYTSGVDGSYTYAQGDTTGFSAFLFAQHGNAPTAVSLQSMTAKNTTRTGLLLVSAVLMLFALLAVYQFTRQRQRSAEN